MFADQGSKTDKPSSDRALKTDTPHQGPGLVQLPILSLPTITCKTDKRLPQSWDAREPDIYIFSSTEDLVPLLQADDSRFVVHTTVPGYSESAYEIKYRKLALIASAIRQLHKYERSVK